MSEDTKTEPVDRHIEEERLSPSRPQRKLWVEPLVALVMALATVGTAWCSYESAKWTRRSNRLMNEFNALERRAGLLNLEGMQFLTIQASMFMQFLVAQHSGNQTLADFYLKRFPPDVRKAYDAWMAEKPSENPNADAHPFVPRLYELRGAKEAAQAIADAENRVNQARRAGNISGQYLGNTVLFATVLFFANAAAKFEQRRVRTAGFGFALAVFGFALWRIATLPF